MYNDRVVIPTSQRNRVLEHLHAAHQGTSTMEQRACSITYWPGMSKDIKKTRESCANCNRNAPSQAATTPISSPPPTTPFESVFADFFDYGGHHYLAVGGRLSSWVEVFGSKAGTTYAGATGLIRHLRSFFATFGVPAELSSDGGPEFVVGSTETFLRTWGVKHRISSAYFPQSDGRAEVAVKTAKRLYLCPISARRGTLTTTDFFARCYSYATLQTRTAMSLLHRSFLAARFVTRCRLPTGLKSSQIRTFAHFGAKHGPRRKTLYVSGWPAHLNP